jgi:glutathionylspermidine synthase
LVEYNADTPSGGRELLGLEPSVWRLHGGAGAGLAPLGRGFAPRLVGAVAERLRAWHSEHPEGPGVVGVVSSHPWVEDMSQAWWLTLLLRRAGIPAVVGDVRDLTVRRGQVRLRDQPIGALYRFYPVERLYRHGVFGQLWEAALDGRLLVLNGLRGFLAQSKGVLAWLWAHRGDPCLERGARALIEDHLPPTVVARHWNGALAGQVVKHVNGREGNEVAFGDDLPRDGWEARLLEGGYVVQRRVYPVPVADVRLDEWAQRIEVVEPRYACVGAFCIDGQFGGCYTRLDGPITTGRAVYVPTFMGS